MKITHYQYNSFVIESGDKKIAIDPGGLFFYWFRFTTLIPKAEWDTITHIFVTHGDPDHYWHTEKMGIEVAIMQAGESIHLASNSQQPQKYHSETI